MDMRVRVRMGMRKGMGDGWGGEGMRVCCHIHSVYDGTGSPSMGPVLTSVSTKVLGPTLGIASPHTQ